MRRRHFLALAAAPLLPAGAAAIPRRSITEFTVIGIDIASACDMTAVSVYRNGPLDSAKWDDAKCRVIDQEEDLASVVRRVRRRTGG